jgi:adenylate kinase
MNETPALLCLFGPPGAGKGTFAEMLAERTGSAHCSIGAEMRRWSSGPLPEQRELAEALARGEYGTDELAMRIVEEFITYRPTSAAVILDGMPRTREQTKLLVARKTFGLRPVGVLIEVPEEVCRIRLVSRRTCPYDGLGFRASVRICPKCGMPTEHRADDGDEVSITRRMALYAERAEPALVAWEKAKLPLLTVANAGSLADLAAATEEVASSLGLPWS